MSLLPRFVYLLLLVILGLMSGCANLAPSQTEAEPHTYLYRDLSLHGRYAPVIQIDEGHLPHNRIGRAAARLDQDGREETYIDPDQPVFYLQEQAFSTDRGEYKNLIYRFHLPRVPYRHLTAGDNGGLIVVVTLDSGDRPVLITTVHSCGCYLAILPTSFLAPETYPEAWDVSGQRIYGEQLPGLLGYPQRFYEQLRPLIRLRAGNHRVRDIALIDLDNLPANTIPIAPLASSSLEKLPLSDGHTSFFHQSGWSRGYVKGSTKPWERLLMSWWTLDWHIGNDKAFGDPEQTGVVFYTSLKPWARKASNMWFFTDFLDYWGWRL